jgi:hypothetical protein
MAKLDSSDLRDEICLFIAHLCMQVFFKIKNYSNRQDSAPDLYLLNPFHGKATILGGCGSNRTID